MIEVHFQIYIYAKCPNNSPPPKSENDNFLDISYIIEKFRRRREMGDVITVDYVFLQAPPTDRGYLNKYLF